MKKNRNRECRCSCSVGSAQTTSVEAARTELYARKGELRHLKKTNTYRRYPQMNQHEKLHSWGTEGLEGWDTTQIWARAWLYGASHRRQHNERQETKVWGHHMGRKERCHYYRSQATRTGTKNLSKCVITRKMIRSATAKTWP